MSLLQAAAVASQPIIEGMRPFTPEDLYLHCKIAELHCTPGVGMAAAAVQHQRRVHGCGGRRCRRLRRRRCDTPAAEPARGACAPPAEAVSPIRCSSPAGRECVRRGVPYLTMLPRPTTGRGPASYTGRVKAAPADRNPPHDHANHPGRRVERQPRERRSGEGSESALATLKNIELDRQKSRPPVEDSNTD